MKINSICVNPVSNNAVSFKSNLLEQKAPEKMPDSDKKKLLTGLAGLAIIGAAAVTTAVLKKKGTTPLKLVKNSLSNLTGKFSDKPEPDPIIKKLNGKRDAEAVRLYKAYKAKDKINSLQTKLLAGEFDGKSSQVFKDLSKNQRKLRREAAIVL